MSLEEISREKLEEVARYLDKFSDGHKSGEEEEFWRLLIKELKKATPASGGKKIRYKTVEVEDFATELLKNESPSLKLLYDLQRKKLSLDVFVLCLEKIGCVGAQNVFRTAAPPVITQHPSSQSLRSGEDIVLCCKAECTPPAVYRWFRGQTPIPNSSSNSLIIRNASSGDSGCYVCRASNPNINDPKKSVFSEWAEVEVIGSTHVVAQSPIRQETGGRLPTLSPPTITLHPTHATVDLGGSAVLECRAEGEGLVYDWYKDGKQFRHDRRHGKLIFDRMRPEDVGEYYCEVVNDGGRIKSSPAKLTVSTLAPLITITEHPKDCRGRVGAGVALRCIAKGPPGQSLVYEWFQKQSDKDKKIVGKGSVCYAELSFTPRFEYRIYCRVSLAENLDVAVQSNVAVITVDSIWITQQPQSIDRHIGERASLVCRAKSCQVPGVDQKITYMWFRSESKGSKKSHVQTCDNGMLIFDKLGQKHWGFYVCQGQNNFQHTQSEEVYVKMGVKPTDGRGAKEVAPPEIRFTKQPWSQVVPLGGSFRLLCEAHSTGDEPLHYQWYFNAVEQNGETADRLIRENVLESDCGSYYCEVRTNTGLARTITNAARIEQAPRPREDPIGKHQSKPMSSTQHEQQEAERFLITAKDERYAREKVALLIGNQGYQCEDMIKLNSPENDTRELAEKLRTLNFKVFSFVNLSFREMMDALEVFYGMLTLSGVYALFYYTGHGFSHGGVTYLMPIDATLPPKCDYNIAADDISAHMQNKKSRAVKILDCCRISDRDDIQSPTQNRTTSLGYSNIVEITSCSSDHIAYESRKESASTFNVALRDALDIPRKMTEVFEQIQDNMRKAPQSLNGKPYQRPELRSSLADPEITLHDHVMLDDPAAEEKAYEIGRKWEQAHALPDPVLLPDKLGGLLSVKLNFSADFSNVLVVRIILIPAATCTSATVGVDEVFLQRQGLRGELYLHGAPPDHPTHAIATLKVANLQRLKGNLKLCLNVSVAEPGQGMKKGTVVHELDQRPLFANLHSPM